MKIDVLFFAQIKDAVGCDTKTFDVDDGATVDDVLVVLRGLPEWTSVASLPLSFAVNERLVAGNHALQNGDRLALLTPISGG
jgi:molybdopterin converting factor small subunit